MMLRLVFAVLFICSGLARAADAPHVFSLRGASLAANRAKLAAGDATLAPALAALRADADGLLKLKPASVMDKTKLPASGDRHDYFSFGPYWWPDPAKPDGLPYIQRDGHNNPDAKVGTDATAFARTCNAVETLGLAYWFTQDERYAKKAASLTQVWFLNPATRMNPNLTHAQAIPGKVTGRGIGLIEARHLCGLTDGLALLGGSAEWTTADAKAMNGWLEAYYAWLKTHANGKEEQAAENNHGSWFDVQATHLALVLGKTADAKKILAEAPVHRLALQIEPDGRMPRELARTKSLDYCLFNLEALSQLARLGENVGVDLWAATTSDGRTLRAAVRYVAPYADPTKKWLREDLKSADRERILPILDETLRHGEDADLRALLTTFAGPQNAGARWRLLK
jgi:hypothetical protein